MQKVSEFHTELLKRFRFFGVPLNVVLWIYDVILCYLLGRIGQKFGLCKVKIILKLNSYLLY